MSRLLFVMVCLVAFQMQAASHEATVNYPQNAPETVVALLTIASKQLEQHQQHLTQLKQELKQCANKFDQLSQAKADGDAIAACMAEAVAVHAKIHHIDMNPKYVKSMSPTWTTPCEMP